MNSYLNDIVSNAPVMIVTVTALGSDDCGSRA